MGQRGPKPLPANVHRLRGNPSKKNFHELSGVVEPPVEIPGCPKHLLPEARKEWKRQGAELLQAGLISKLDRPAFAIYCQEWAWFVWADELYQRDVRLAGEAKAKHDAAEAALVAAAELAGETYTPAPWLGGDGLMVPTPNGSFTYNPHWVARNKHAEKVDKFLASFGMSPSSRGRVTPSSNQIPLFPSDQQPQHAGGFHQL